MMSSSRASGALEPAEPFVPDPMPMGRSVFQPSERIEPDSASGEPKPVDEDPVRSPERGGFDEGYAQGLRDGLEKGRQEAAAEAREDVPDVELAALQSAVLALQEAASSVSVLRRGYLEDNRRMLVEIAMAVAEKLLRTRIEQDPDALAGIVEQALGQLGDLAPVQLRLATCDHEALQSGHARVLEELASRHDLRVEADPRLAAGDVRVLAERTEVNARLGEVLRRIREELFGCAGSNASGEASQGSAAESGTEAVATDGVCREDDADASEGDEA